MAQVGFFLSALEIVSALVAIYLVHMLTVWLAQRDQITIQSVYSKNTKMSIPCFTGLLDSTTPNIRFNTTVPTASNYLPLKPSTNTKGGAQFSYSFWINISTASTATIANKVIFLKGLANTYNFKTTQNVSGDVTIHEAEHLVYCPMLRFGNNMNTIEVIFNTLAKHDDKLIIESSSDDTYSRNNLMSIVQGSWMMFTISFEDNMPINDFENGVIVRFYMNDVLYKTGKYKSALKQNYGDLYMFPNKDPLIGVKVSDLQYFNYAVSLDDVIAMHKVGPNLKPSELYLTKYTAQSVSSYNTLDIYNS
jgi:hypothetical protein